MDNYLTDSGYRKTCSLPQSVIPYTDGTIGETLRGSEIAVILLLLPQNEDLFGMLTRNDIKELQTNFQSPPKQLKIKF